MANLIIADSAPEVTSSLNEFFSKLGFCIYTTNIPEEIIDLVQQYKPDIIIMEIRFENIERWDIIRKVKSIATNVKIVICYKIVKCPVY